MKINELNEKAKERALDKLREGIEFDDEPVIEDWKHILTCLGFSDIDIYWSGFGSQGDGACFDGYWYMDRVNIEALKGYLSNQQAEEYGAWFHEKLALVKVAGEDPFAYTATLSHVGPYYHYGSVRFEVEAYKEDEFAEPLFDTDEFEREFTEQCKSLMRQICRDLEAEYEYQTSDEYLTETAESNEYEFDEEGNQI